MEAGDGGLVPASLRLKGLDGASQHVEFTLQVRHGLVQLVDRLPVLLPVLLGLVQSETGVIGVMSILVMVTVVAVVVAVVVVDVVVDVVVVVMVCRRW